MNNKIDWMFNNISENDMVEEMSLEELEELDRILEG